MDPVIGDRVVVRYRLGADAPADWRPAPNPALEHEPSQSDLTGILRGRTDDAVLIDRVGTTESVPTAAITSIRPLSRHVVRNADIRRVQSGLQEAVEADDRGEVDGWSLTATPGSADPHANAAIPSRFGAGATALPAIADWFSAHGTTGHLIVPDRLLREAGVSGGTEYEVLTGPDGARIVAGDHRATRERLRDQGFELHHCFRLIPLSPTV
ncbi:MAG: GCN5 family acetyltransferase [Gordonia sp. (in: high G+C Gram-positive bacteria)]|uniref:GNAT family N-acetyltransferase, cg3035/Rv0428c family n=1 Tax=Gordonia sp. (in: high G+C Gram-positive bacteria) TaxID=84139 RepID=UPI0039E59503